jgi:nitrite reductase/ring-hydroxylating ferredoxin subunit
VTPLCTADSLDPGRPVIAQLTATHSVILLRLADGVVVAYRNACPHMGIELDWEPQRLLARGGQYLRCTGHGALFRLHDGMCVRGPCAGDALSAVPVHVEQGVVVLDG